MDWGRYIATATIAFHVQPSEAWLLTPQEYWDLYDVHHEVNGTASKPRDYLTTTEANDLIADLTRRGKL